jgi:hypothetical protein
MWTVQHLPRSLRRFAQEKFPRLMEHPTNREDALQTLALVHHMSHGVGELRLARRALIWLEYELGIVPMKPVFPNPVFNADTLEPGTLLDEVDRDLALIRQSA